MSKRKMNKLPKPYDAMPTQLWLPASVTQRMAKQGGNEQSPETLRVSLRKMIQEAYTTIRSGVSYPHIVCVIGEHDKGQSIHILDSGLEDWQMDVMLEELANFTHHARVENQESVIDPTRGQTPEDFIDAKQVREY